MLAAPSKDVVLGTSLALSIVSLVLLFGVTWYFQSSLDLLQQQVEHDRELLLKLQEKIEVRNNIRPSNYSIHLYQHTIVIIDSHICL